MTDDTFPGGLGWIESPPDPRDYPIADAYMAVGLEVPDAASLPAAYSVPLPVPPTYNQLSTPQCVAYSNGWEQAFYDLRDTGSFMPDTNAFFAAIGGTQYGALIRNALAYRLSTGYPPLNQPSAVGLHKIAAYYAVPIDQASLCAAIFSFGPIVIGTPWYRSWFYPVGGILPAAYPSAPVGGHAIIASGWTATGLLLTNSWGSSWGMNGSAILPWSQVPLLREAWKAIDVIDVAPKTWRIQIAPGATVRYVAGFNAAGQITGWYNSSRSWPAGSSAPCNAPVLRYGTGGGHALVALCTAGVYVGKWIYVGGTAVTVSSS